ncbi:Adaptor complexe medium subunit family protein [Aphelenchoides bicaudatus]|nr:Adaptor complexe medium subunit family protein [Aphelenchoides bicaudatus]
MSCSAIFILDMKGNVIMSRNYRGDVEMSEIEKFMTLVMEQEDEGKVSPMVQSGELSYIYIKHMNIFLVSVSKKNANVALILSFLYKCVDVFTSYFKDLEEESVRDNFVVIYEFYPQTTEPKILQEYITQETHQLEIAPRPPMAVTNAVSWRSEGLKYRKNEVFLDVIESVNLLADASGTVLRSEIIGSIKMRVMLSGMPELRLGLNDKLLFQNGGRGGKSVELEDVKFHQCVRLSRFESERTISFIPPDGDFELMSYRLNATIKPLVWVEVSVEKHAHSRIEFMVKAKSQFKRQSLANHVEVLIPVPSDADSPKFKSSVGSAEDDEKRLPIRVKFEVRYLKIIEKSGYQALPWVRYVTANGDYQIRMN